MHEMGLEHLLLEEPIPPAPATPTSSAAVASPAGTPAAAGGAGATGAPPRPTAPGKRSIPWAYDAIGPLSQLARQVCAWEVEREACCVLIVVVYWCVFWLAVWLICGLWVFYWLGRVFIFFLVKFCQVLSCWFVFFCAVYSLFEVIYLSFVSVLHMTYFCFWRLRSHLPPDLGRSQHPVRTNSGHFTLNA